ncbi:MAG: hypothetical protein PF636_09475 [Actinomycetota bacterium]|nr:hypothetical protein [Actinomycetota bacterium]
MGKREKQSDVPRESLGGAPDMPDAGDEEERLRCRTDRQALTPRQTADCAGNDLAELYENEEDGGS